MYHVTIIGQIGDNLLILVDYKTAVKKHTVV